MWPLWRFGRPAVQQPRSVVPFVTVVIARKGGDPVPRDGDDRPRRSAFWTPRLRGMTSGYAKFVPRREAPGFCPSRHPPEPRGHGEGRVFATPMARLQQKSRRQSPQVRPNIRHSLRDGFNGCFAISPVRRAFWPPCAHDAFASARIPASGYQDRTISPCASNCSSARKNHAAASTRPPHPAPNIS